MGRDLKKSLDHPSAQSRVNSKGRPGYSGLYPVGSWKPRKVKTAQILWATYPTASRSPWGKTFCLYPIWTSLVWAYVCCLSSSFMAHCAGPGSTSFVPPCRHLVWLFSPPEVIPGPGWMSPAPSASPHRASVLQLPTVMVALNWIHSWLSASVWDWRSTTGSPFFYNTPTEWRKYLGNRKLLFSVFFPLWAQLPSYISVLLTGLPGNGCSAMGRCVLCRYTWPVHLGWKVNWDTVPDFYLPVIWERGQKDEILPATFFHFSLNRLLIHLSFIVSHPVWFWKSQLLQLFCTALSLKFPC